jgi:hypothetical protein
MDRGSSHFIVRSEDYDVVSELAGGNENKLGKTKGTGVKSREKDV